MDNEETPQEVTLDPDSKWALVRAVTEAVKWEMIGLALKAALGAAVIALIFQAGMSWAYADEAEA